MTPATTTTRLPSTRRIANSLPVAFAGTASVASLLAAVGGGTVARLTLAITVPIAIGAWIQAVRHARPPALVLAVLVLLVVAGSIHTALTSPAAVWAVDSHMVPAALLPGASARIAVAWAVPVLWTAAFVAMAVAAHRRVGTPVGALLLGVGVAPLLTSNAFPVDAYRLLWDSTALGHPIYAIGAWAVLLATLLTHDRATRRPA